MQESLVVNGRALCSARPTSRSSRSSMTAPNWRSRLRPPGGSCAARAAGMRAVPKAQRWNHPAGRAGGAEMVRVPWPSASGAARSPTARSTPGPRAETRRSPTGADDQGGGGGPTGRVESVEGHTRLRRLGLGRVLVDGVVGRRAHRVVSRLQLSRYELARGAAGAAYALSSTTPKALAPAPPPSISGPPRARSSLLLGSSCEVGVSIQCVWTLQSILGDGRSRPQRTL